MTSRTNSCRPVSSLSKRRWIVIAAAAIGGASALGCSAPARVYYVDDGGDAAAQSDGSSGGGSDGTITGDAPAEAQEDATEDAADAVSAADEGADVDAGSVADAGDGASPVDTGAPDGSDGAPHDAAADVVVVEAGCGLLNTTTNCGACGNACDTAHSIGASCDGTSCHYTGCVANRADCNTTAPDLDGCETPINTTTNCGGCGVACDTVTSAGVSCSGGSCQYSGCAAGYADCDTTPPNANGCETIITNNAANCGGCGLACDTTNSTGTTCSSSKCQYSGCKSGFADCASTAPDLNGCETSLSSTTSCSGCGLACDSTNSVGATCNGTTCSYSSCAPGYKNCSKTAPDTNGCETRVNTTTNCGDCGVTCGTLNAGTIGCSGTACTYTCNAGYSNCNTTGSNTTGCECHSTGCCVSGTAQSSGAPGATCQTVHTNGPTSIGLGQQWDDCAASSTFNATQALAACIAKYGAAGGCQGGWTCGTGASKVTQPMICNSTPGCTTCWGYGTQTGTYAVTPGSVTDCACPGNNVGTWN